MQRAILQGLSPAGLMTNARRIPPNNPDSPAKWAIPTPAELNDVIDHLQVEELIGRGSMGVVYRGRQIDLDRDVAIKILPVECLRHPELVERFRREIRAASRLRHPNIVTIHEMGQTPDGALYYVMEYINGMSLRALLDHGALAVDEAISTIRALCDALQSVHDAGLIHRDIKPSNILTDEHGDAMLMDFGVVAFKDIGEVASLTQSGQFVGTNVYASPEQITGQATIDHRADLYSLGVTFYESLTGKLPLGNWRLPSEHNSNLPSSLDATVQKLLEQSAADRYQSAGEVADKLNQNVLPWWKSRAIIAFTILAMLIAVGIMFSVNNWL